MNHESHTVYIHIFIDFDLQQGLNLRLKSAANASDIWTVIIISTMEWNVALRPCPGRILVFTAKSTSSIYALLNTLFFIMSNIVFTFLN